MSVVNEPRPASNGEHSFAFGSLRLFPNQRLLLDGDKPVRLGSRALDLLAVLADSAGRVVPKEELIAKVLAEHLCRGEQSQAASLGTAPCLGRWSGRRPVHRHGTGSGVRVCRPGQPGG